LSSATSSTEPSSSPRNEHITGQLGSRIDSASHVDRPRVEPSLHATDRRARLATNPAPHDACRDTKTRWDTFLFPTVGGQGVGLERTTARDGSGPSGARANVSCRDVFDKCQLIFMMMMKQPGQSQMGLLKGVQLHASSSHFVQDMYRIQLGPDASSKPALALSACSDPDKKPRRSHIF
jgi:hypothetical protein